MKRRRHEIADRAVRSDLVVALTPSLAFSARFVEAEEPVHVQTFSAELAVQAFDEGVVRRLAGPTEVERLLSLTCPLPGGERNSTETAPTIRAD